MRPATPQSNLEAPEKPAQRSPTKRKAFTIDSDDEADTIPADMRPEDGWITPQSRKIGKRARFTEQDRASVAFILEKLNAPAPGSYVEAPSIPAPIKTSRVKLTPSSKYDPTKYLKLPRAVLRKPLDEDMIDELTVKKLKETGAPEKKSVTFKIPDDKQPIVINDKEKLESSLSKAQESQKDASGAALIAPSLTASPLGK